MATYVYVHWNRAYMPNADVETVFFGLVPTFTLDSKLLILTTCCCWASHTKAFLSSGSLICQDFYLTYACYKMPEPWAMTRSHLRRYLVFESPVLVYQGMITRWLCYDGIRFTPTRLSSLNIVEDNSKFTRVTCQWYLISLHLQKVWLS